MSEFNVIGKELSNDQVYGKVTGRIHYCGDETAPGMLYMKLKASSISHGRIRSVDVSRAEQLPGVRAIYTCENTPDRLYDRGRVAPWETVPNQERLFNRHVRYMGERVAAVVAVSEEIAQQACRLIDVEYELLPLAVSIDEAEQDDAPKLHPEGNIYPCQPFEYGNYAAVSDAICHSSHSHIGRMTHLTLETQACRAKYNASEQTLTIWTGCQSVFGVRSTVADFLQMPYSNVRVIKTPMGGSFGSRQETLVEPLTAYAAQNLQSEVRLVYSREEQIVNTMMKHSLDADVESKVSSDGVIQGLSLSCRLDAGAYLTVSRNYVSTIGEKINKVYRIPNLHFDGRAVCTNTPINGSFRSWGSCELTLCLENHWNLVADELGLDPIEFRSKNIHQPYDQEVVHQISIGNAHFETCLLQGRDAFHWEARKEDCRTKNAEQQRYRYGIGMALASHTTSFYPNWADVASSNARLQEDGSLIIHVAVHDHGCGTVMALKKIASEVTQIPIEKILLPEADTQSCRYDRGCYASRTIYSLGQSVKQCCQTLMHQLRKKAAAALQCSETLLHYQAGVFFLETDKARQITLPQIYEYSLGVIGEDIFCSVTTNATANPGVPAAHFTHVRVDTYTGLTKVLDCLSVHDVGKAINPDLCRGQVGSGIQQGIGMALCEEIKIHPKTGEALITNFKNYDVTNAVDMPTYQVIFIEDPEPTAPFGAKSLGEVVLAPVAPALVAAVNHALGTKLHHLPLTPAVILEALEAQT